MAILHVASLVHLGTRGMRTYLTGHLATLLWPNWTEIFVAQMAGDEMSLPFQITMFLAVGQTPISSSAPWPLGVAYVPIVLSEVEQEQRLSGNGDPEAIVVEAGLCDGEGESAYTVYDPILAEEKCLIYFKLFAGAKTGYRTICR